MVRSSSTLAVGWISDSLASALAASFREFRAPADLTILYAATCGLDRVHGLNRLAISGMVRRVIGGQWHPVPALHAMAKAGEIEAYSLPTGLINRLFRDMAEGLANHISRLAVGTAADPRRGGGRLNRRTRLDLVHLIQAAGEEALLVPAIPVDVGLVGVGFLADTGAIVMARHAQTIAKAVHQNGGMVIAMPDRIGTQPATRPGEVQVADTLVDILVVAGPREEARDNPPQALGGRALAGLPPLGRA